MCIFHPWSKLDHTSTMCVCVCVVCVCVCVYVCVCVCAYSWKLGEITNFEYLMELNKLAGRTFNDLMQYPVFPFILANYTMDKLDLRSSTSFRHVHSPSTGCVLDLL